MLILGQRTTCHEATSRESGAIAMAGTTWPNHGWGGRAKADKDLAKPYRTGTLVVTSRRRAAGMALSKLVLVLFLAVGKRSAPPVEIPRVLGAVRPGWVSPHPADHGRRDQTEQDPASQEKGLPAISRIPVCGPSTAARHESGRTV